MVALNTNFMYGAWGQVHLQSAHRENKHLNIFFVGRWGHYWAKKLKAPGKHQKSRECMANHEKHLKILENSGTSFQFMINQQMNPSISQAFYGYSRGFQSFPVSFDYLRQIASPLCIKAAHICQIISKFLGHLSTQQPLTPEQSTTLTLEVDIVLIQMLGYEKKNAA